MKKVLFPLGIILTVLAVGFFVLNSYIYNAKQADDVDPSISSFEECIDAGYPTLDSYPEQCETPDGKRFMRNLPEGELINAISPIIITGTLTCLPHWDTSGPQTLECAFGLLEDSRNYYVLRSTDPTDLTLGSIPTDSRVEIVGALIPGSDEKYQSIGTIEVENIYPWQKFMDEESGITFEYPEALTTEYIEVTDWPPQVQILDEPLACTEAGDVTTRAGRTEERIIGERTYCVTETNEGAAGSVYTQYAYATEINNKTVVLTFSTRASQCENYSEPEMNECTIERGSFSPDSLIARIFQTLEITSQ